MICSFVIGWSSQYVLDLDQVDDKMHHGLKLVLSGSVKSAGVAGCRTIEILCTTEFLSSSLALLDRGALAFLRTEF